MNLLFYFLAGLVQDIVVTTNWLLIAKGHKGQAAILSAIAVALSVSVFYGIVTDMTHTLANILAYSLGTGIGTYLAMSFMSKGQKDSKGQ